MSIERISIKKTSLSKLKGFPTQDPFGGVEERLILPVNPETISLAYSVSYDQNKPKKHSGRTLKWQDTPPRKLSFEFLLDGTGAIPGSLIPGSILPNILALESTFFSSSDDNSTKPLEPNLLWIQWSQFHFKCVLDSMNITYKLYNEKGDPVRANVSVSFSEFMWTKPKDASSGTSESGTSNNNANAKEQNPASRESAASGSGNTGNETVVAVQDGIRLPQLSESMTGDPNNYSQIAIEKKLIQFRNLQAGRQLLLKKAENGIL